MKSKTGSKFYLAIDQIMRKLTVLDRSEKFCYGVTISQCYAIETLYKKKSLSMNELSSFLGVAISTLTRILDILFRDGIITRNHSSEDRRKVIIALTDKGTDLAEKLVSCTEKYSREILENIPAGKREDVIACLEIFNSALEKVKNKCCQ